MGFFQYISAHPAVTVFLAALTTLAACLAALMALRARWSRRLLEAVERANHDLGGQLAVVEALSRDYANVWAINTDDATASIIKISDRRVLDSEHENDTEVDYQRIVENYAAKKVHPDDRAAFIEELSLENVLDKLARKDEFSGTYRALVNGGVYYFQYTFVRPSEKAGASEIKALAGFRNIDQVMRREEEQRRILQEALESSRYASAAKTAFLNNMSHDIRTPMNAIIGFANLALANAENTDLTRRYLEKIMISGSHLLKLINDVLNMSRIESGKIKIKEEKLSLAGALRDMRTILQADLKAKSLAFSMEADNVVHETVYCDKLRLNQVLLNILSNAIKYTPSGGRVGMTVTEFPSARPGGARFEFHIKDNGIGMSPEFLKHVFEPFEREQTATVSGIEGTGLGLAITKRIVEMMGGEISARSEIGKGSDFAVSLTFTAETEGAAPAPELSGKPALAAWGDRKAGGRLISMLERLGMKASLALSADEALKMARARAEEPYDICLISQSLPDMDAEELARRLRGALPKGARAVILRQPESPEAESADLEYGLEPVFLSELAGILAGRAEAESPEGGAPRSSGLFNGKRVLLVEDNEMNQEIARMILEEAGFSVDLAENGREAVDKIAAGPSGAYDLVLMDVQMPVMNGYQATREIRSQKDPQRAGVSIIAMTANAFDEDREEAERSGMNGYVAKPIDINSLFKTLEAVIRSQGGAGAKD